MKRTILIVEDNPITRKMMRVVLEIAGYRVLEAGDGRTAIDLVATQPPDLVLQDLILPDMDGIELIRPRRTARAAIGPSVHIGRNRFQPAGILPPPTVIYGLSTHSKRGCSPSTKRQQGRSVTAG